MKPVLKPLHALRASALAFTLALGGCNLFDEDAKKPLADPTYTAAPTYVVAQPITPIAPANSLGAGTAYSIAPPLPAGLSINASTGIISGTPTVETDSIGYIVTAARGGDTARVALGFAVVSAWYGMPLDSLQGASALLIHDGRLLVANRSATKPGVAVVDTATGLIKTYYRELLPPSSMAATAGGRVIIAETDYVQGAVSVLDPAGRTIQTSVISFGSDNGVAAADGKVFLFNRTTGVVTGFTGNTPGQGVVLDVQTGAGSNPYGIAVTGGKAYIPRYNLKSLLILGDVNQVGGGARDSIDLSAYAKDTASGAPRMSLVAAHGGYVFVALQRLNHQYATLDTSLLVVINASTKAIEKTIPLNFRNPIAGTVKDGVWYITGISGYGDVLGGVEKIDLVTRLHAGSVVTEATLGADVFDFVPGGTGTGYASYSSDFGFTTKVRKVSF
jgi:hypothetical protein